MSAETDLDGISGYIADKISDKIGEDRLIAVGDEPGRWAYIDTEGCAVYLITIQRADLVPVGAEQSHAPAPAEHGHGRPEDGPGEEQM